MSKHEHKHVHNYENTAEIEHKSLCEHNHDDCCCEHSHDIEHEKFFYARIILSIILFIISFKFHLLFIFAYFVIGYDILFKAVQNIIKGKIFDENFLMSVATIGAICIKEYPEAVMVMILYQIGEYLQHKAVDKSKKSIAELMDIRPDFANKIEGESINKVLPQEVNINDIILVKAGEKIPLDGIIAEGEGFVDTSSLTGEAMPQKVRISDEVYSGCINLDSVLKIKVTKRYEESEVSKILELVEHARNKKTKTENFITRFAKNYTPIVVILAFLIAIIPQFFFSGNWIERALTFLVISCPCALVISVPLTFFAGIGKCSQSGILVKGSVYLEKLSKIKNAVFDKTGTLTKGEFEVVHINSENPKILEYAALAESASNHPIAKAIKKAYGKQTEIIETQEFSGLGIKAEIDGKELLVGNSDLVKVNKEEIQETVVYVSLGGEYLGNIVLADTIKPDSKELIKQLNKQGINTFMLTGDSEYTAKKVQNEIGIKTVYSKLLPNDKVEKIEQIIKQTQNGFTIFTGDGINDAPVLQRADVGISMGALGSDAAIEASDIVIMDDKLKKILQAIVIGKQTMLIVNENITAAIFIKVLFLMLGALGFMTMWGAVFADVGVTFIAILNALRVLK